MLVRNGPRYLEILDRLGHIDPLDGGLSAELLDIVALLVKRRHLKPFKNKNSSVRIVIYRVTKCEIIAKNVAQPSFLFYYCACVCVWGGVPSATVCLNFAHQK
jgi:hypothetical protein